MDKQEAIKCLDALAVCGEHHSTVSISQKDRAALNMAISDMQKITMLEKLTETHKQSGHAPTRTISMEDLRGVLNLE